MAQALQLLSLVWPSCAQRHVDTAECLNHQGDLVEIALALCHDDNAFALLCIHSIEIGRSAYADLCSFCSAVDHLYRCVRMGSSTKRDPRNVLGPCPTHASVRAHVGNNSSLMADLVLNIVNSEHETIFH